MRRHIKHCYTKTYTTKHHYTRNIDKFDIFIVITQKKCRYLVGNGTYRGANIDIFLIPYKILFFLSKKIHGFS